VCVERELHACTLTGHDEPDLEFAALWQFLVCRGRQSRIVCNIVVAFLFVYCAVGSMCADFFFCYAAITRWGRDVVMFVRRVGEGRRAIRFLLWHAHLVLIEVED
jgi:hypothetical protein